MTAQIIGNIGDNWHQIAGYTKELLSTHGTPEKERCARDRQNFWLKAEPNYAEKTYFPAIENDRLWNYIKTICPRADLAQVFGGNKAIDWHRDAAYAHSTAWILALGKSTFQIEKRSGEFQSINLPWIYEDQTLTVKRDISEGGWAKAVPVFSCLNNFVIKGMLISDMLRRSTSPAQPMMLYMMAFLFRVKQVGASTNMRLILLFF